MPTAKRSVLTISQPDPERWRAGGRTARQLARDPKVYARVAGLKYVTDTGPGISRKKVGAGFTYMAKDGSRVRDKEVLRRIRGLVIPPAWTKVWICADPHGHIQATGRDARGRKQYRYHADWRAVRSSAKYHRMLDFGRALPNMRRRIQKDLKREGLPREKVLAAIVELLASTLIRVGNAEYARDNGSYGLTTLRSEHVRVRGALLKFRFRGKSGREAEVDLNDPRLAKIVRRCQELRGQELFAYLDESGSTVDVSSSDVNDYLREISGSDFTAKDFRTWGGTVRAFRLLRDAGPCSSATDGKRCVTNMIKIVSGCLRNTAATCRNYYVHPAVVEAYLDGSLSTVRLGAPTRSVVALAPSEVGLLSLLAKKVPKLPL